MTAERQVLVFEDVDSLTAAVAARFIETMRAVLDAKPSAHVVLTGGRVGIGILAAVNDSPLRDSLEWERIHLWWGDERWLPAGDEERNDRQAEDALLGALGLTPKTVHRPPAADGDLDLDAAAAEYARELRAHAEPGANVPAFDILLLGVGPDGHIASLFPDDDGIAAEEATVIPVRNSPKPPPERLSLTLPAINAADRVWLALGGADKASALCLALAGANTAEVPAAGPRGRQETTFFVDTAAAAESPAELIVEG